jgi:Flp pilus assembly protein TadD, contains TPR repeats
MARAAFVRRFGFQRVAICLGLLVLVFAVYLQTARFGFVNYDDGSYVFENSVIRAGLTWHGLVWAFTHIHSQNWHPLTSLSHMLDCQFFDLRAGAHHLTNVVLHAACVLCLFEFFRRTTKALWASAAAAAIWGIHPLRVESVAWISERKDVLSGLFFVLTLLSYFRYAQRPTWSRMLMVAVTLALGLMSKPMLVTTPVLLLLLDYWPLNRARSFAKLVGEKIPLFLLSAASCFATITAQRLALGTTENLPLKWRLSNAVVSYFTYLRQIIWPHDLIPFYVHPEGRLLLIEVALCSVVLLVATIAVTLCRRSRPYLFVGWLWYLLTLLPVIGIIQVGLQGHADRYTYLPSIGIIIALVWMVVDATARWRFRTFVLAPITVAIVLILAGLSYAQTNHWRNTESLWSYTLRISPDNDVAHAGLAGIQLVRGDLENASDHYRRALELRDGNSAAHYGLALALAKERKFDEAIAHWEKSLEIQPDNATARNYLGAALVSVGRERDAVAQWRQTLDYDPENGDAMNNLAWVLANTRDSDLRDPAKAIQLAERAATLPGGDNAIVYRTLAAALAENRQFDVAIAAAEHARTLAITAKNSALADEMGRWVALFQQGQTLRDARETR